MTIPTDDEIRNARDAAHLYEMLQRLPKEPFDAEAEDDPMSTNQQAFVNALTPDQMDYIDERLMMGTASNWRKVARVVGAFYGEDVPEELQTISDVFLAQRVAFLVQEGHLTSQGNLKAMRFSEVRQTP